MNILDNLDQVALFFFYIYISNKGIGISDEFLGQIFTPFEREKNTTLSGVHGTGLGTRSPPLYHCISRHCQPTRTGS